MAYSEHTRAKALIALELNEGNVLKTANQLGLPEATLRNWVAKTYEPETDLSDSVNAIVEQKRDDFIANLKVLRNSTMVQFEESIPDLKAKEAASALIELTKLIELLEGNATQRVEAVYNGESVGDAIERYREEFESRINRAQVLEVESSRVGDSESESTSA